MTHHESEHGRRGHATTGWRWGSRRGGAASRCHGRNRLKPELLLLEDRRLLSTFPVTSTADTLDSNNNPTSGTLRWAVEQADAATTPSTITFDPTVFATAQTITLSHGQLKLSNTNDSITIDSPASGLTVSGGSVSRVFQVDKGVTVSISGLTIAAGSTSGNGGGLDNAGTATLTECTISGNSGFAGGGLYNAGTTTLTECTVSGNSGAGSGGGLFNLGTANLTACTVSGNSTSGASGGTGGGALGEGGSGSGNGGGLFNRGTVNLTNCTLSGNSAINGGGLFNYGPATMIACTVSGNTGVNGACGIYDYGYKGTTGTVTLTDTIVLQNLTLAFSEYDIADSFSEDPGSVITGSYNLIGASEPGILPGGTDGNIEVKYNFGVTPLGDYGGSTQTVAPVPGSPAIGAGIAISGVTTDQRGEPLDSPDPDIGAFQSQGFTLTPVAGSTPQSAAPGFAFANPLAVTVTAKNSIEPVAGGVVTFTCPSSGASADLSGTTATIGSNGVASVTATANTTIGSFAVTAAANGATNSVDFALKNLVPLTFSGLSDQSIAYGTSSLTVSGTLTDGSQVPQGETVAVTLNGVQQSAIINSAGAFSTTFDTSSLAVSGSPYTISYAYTSDGTFASASATSTLTVTQATPTITWPNPSAITYGTALSATQLDATASVPGIYTYTPAVGTVLKAGAGQTLSVTFTPMDSTDYSTATATATINVHQATPVMTWANPADITYGTVLSSTQLDAAASWTVSGSNQSVGGTFIYNPAAGAVLSVGKNQTLSVSFTPTDTTDYTTTTATATINVDKAIPTVTWADPADITYGTALSSTQLDATASVPGAFTYTPAVGTVLHAGNGQTLSVTFTPTDTTDYATTTATATINVDKAIPTVAWPNPAEITYGTALSSTQLDATASVPGAFTYTPVASAVLHAGNGQTLSVTFSPTDNTDYTTTTATATINIDKATPTITWPNPADITYATALSSSQLDATAPIPGIFTYTPSAGTVLHAGNGQTLSVSFSPADTIDYTTATGTARINVNQATPTITWTNPAYITYGTALSSTQLDATASVPGTFTYTPAVGTVLHAGNGQTLSVFFTPTDSTDYSSATASATINVDKATPTVTWPNPVDITYGTALSPTQLDALGSVHGAFTYTPAAGTMLSAGNGQTLSVSFTPTDTTDYMTTTASATINVDKATPTITWANPADISYGAALSSTQLDATASVPGTFTYNPAAGMVLQPGKGQTLSVSFTPADTNDYTGASATASINVAQVATTITWANPADIIYGTSLGALQLDAMASVPGTFTYTPALGTVLKAGAGQTLAVTFTPTDTTTYAPAAATATIDVDKATPTLNVSAPSGAYDGTPFPASFIISGINNSPAASLEGVTPTLAYYVGSNASGTSLGSTPPTRAGTYTVVASFAGSADYAPKESAPATFTIGRGSTTIGLTSSGGAAVFGQSVAFVATVKATGTPGGTVTFFDGATPLGTAALDGSGKATLTTTDLAIGSQAITADYSGSADFLGARSGGTTETVNRDATEIIVVPHPVFKKKRLKAVSMTATIEPLVPGGGVPTGLVTFELLVKHRKKIKVKTLGTAALIGGQATLTFKPQKLLNKTLTIVYSGDTNFEAASVTLPKLTRKSLL